MYCLAVILIPHSCLDSYEKRFQVNVDFIYGPIEGKNILGYSKNIECIFEFQPTSKHADDDISIIFIIWIIILFREMMRFIKQDRSFYENTI